MVFRSLRWQLQVWHAVLLVVVLVGFGITACQLQRASRFREIDRELDASGLEVMRYVRENDPSRGRPGRPTPRLPRLANPGIYFVAWSRDGKELERSPEAPAELQLSMVPKDYSPRRSLHQIRETYREAIFRMPPGETVIVGRSIAADLDDLRRFAIGLTVTGTVVLASALIMGAWLAGRAMRPLKEIGASARRIAAGSHSDRIDTRGLPEELAGLATLLNEGFHQIEETLVRQRQFTADASHELRTPVSVVLTQTQSALARPRSEPEYRHALEACQRAAERMRRLVESLLTLARLESGEEPLRREACDLNAIAQETIETIRPLAHAHRISLQFDPNANQVQAQIDPNKVSQVLLNLLGNAVAYNRPEGSIHVKTGTSGNETFISVADTGIGIAAEHLPRVFERFYRVDASRTDPRGHTGLGLAISQQIVQQHGGRITVESQLGKGSIFTAWFTAL